MSAAAAGRRCACVALLAIALAPAARAQQVDARLDRASAVAGESVTLIVGVRDGKPSGDPQFDVPSGLELLSSGRSENFSWVNGRTTSETQFRYEIGVEQAGRYVLGPIQVRVGNRAFRSGTLALEVTAAARQVGHSGSGPASLSVTVEPREPYVGEPVMLRVRLVQRAPFAEDPQYTPPTTTGFWSGPSSQPASYYADEGGRRVLVTETRTRLYPLAAGEAVIGEAAASVVLASGGRLDPFAWLGGGAGRPLNITSPAIRVPVRPLPPGTPDGFGGAVGRFTVAWGADRGRTGRDVPFTVRLDVRGRGNLPLVRPPAFDSPDAEVLASSVDDSLGDPAGAAGRKRFQWTLLPRREGTIPIAAPGFVSFDPSSRTWERQQAPPIVMQVGPPVYGGAAASAGFPVELATEPVPAEPRAVRGWVFAIAGLLIGLAVALVRRSGVPDPGAAERGRALEWLRAVGRTGGPDFWRAAGEAIDWLGGRGESVEALRAQVSEARYAGAGAQPDPVRRALVERLSRALPPPPPRAALRAIAVLALVLAAAGVVLLGRSPAPPRRGAGLAVADAAARRGDVAGAESAWRSAWREGVRHPALAARLGWARLDAGSVGEAGVWVLRGRRLEARDAALAWTAGRVREGGGLLGSAGPRIPLRRMEWGVLALLLGALAGLAWPRRVPAIALTVLALCSGVAPALEEWRDRVQRPGVVVRAVRVGAEGVELQPGQVVRLRASRPREVQVAAGRAATGWVAADAVLPVDGGEDGGR